MPGGTSGDLADSGTATPTTHDAALGCRSSEDMEVESTREYHAAGGDDDKEAVNPEAQGTAPRALEIMDVDVN